MKKFKITILLISFIFMNLSLFSQTYIFPGNVYDGYNGNWNASGSPYIILGDIYVPAGNTLTISDYNLQQGADLFVLFYNTFPNNPFKFEIYGQLIAIGNTIRPASITFEPYFLFDPFSIYWGGINFHTTSGNSLMKYCHVIYNKDNPTIEIDDDTNVYGQCIIDSCFIGYSYNATASALKIKDFNILSHCYIIGNEIYYTTNAPGLEIDSTLAQIYIDSNYIRNNTSIITPQSVGGVYIYNCPNNPINNNIKY